MRSRRWVGRFVPGILPDAVTNPSATLLGCSTASCKAGSTTTAASTSRCCIPSCGASTIIWCAGPAGSTSGCADARNEPSCSWPASPDASRKCSLTGVSDSNLLAGRWEPCKPRGFRTVLRAAGGEIPPADSPRCWLSGSFRRRAVLRGPGAAFRQVLPGTQCREDAPDRVRAVRRPEPQATGPRPARDVLVPRLHAHVREDAGRTVRAAAQDDREADGGQAARGERLAHATTSL